MILKDTSNWVWISSARCSVAEIVMAQVIPGHWWVNDDYMGFVLVSSERAAK